MIRRELKTIDGAAHWLLISQVEHARVSGILAMQWTAADLSPYQFQGQPLPKATTDEILAAVTHHDAGWAQWETEPGIDPAQGRPYSFMNELPFDESLAIWSDSIAAAHIIGPLAGWMVAGHFSELLQNGNHESEPRAVAWLEQMRQSRAEWLREWKLQRPEHASRIAERALHLLQACDFLSLWLCCDCPVSQNEAVTQVPPFTIEWPQYRIGPYRFEAHRETTSALASDQHVAEPAWRVTAAPWPFQGGRLELMINASLVPIRRYASSRELLESRQFVELRWQCVHAQAR